MPTSHPPDDCREALVTVSVLAVATSLGLTAAQIEHIENHLNNLILPLHGRERDQLPARIHEEIQYRQAQRDLDDLHAAGGTTCGLNGDPHGLTTLISGLLDGTYHLADDQLAAFTSTLGAELTQLALQQR